MRRKFLNIVAAVRIAGWPHLPCFVHTINLIVINSIYEVPDEACTIKNTKITTSVACCEISSGMLHIEFSQDIFGYF